MTVKYAVQMAEANTVAILLEIQDGTAVPVVVLGRPQVDYEAVRIYDLEDIARCVAKALAKREKEGNVLL